MGKLQLVLAMLPGVASCAKPPTRLGARSTAREVVSAFGGPAAFAGKTAVITGGASGIGLETAKALALAGCKVIIASRNPTKYAPACEKAIKQQGSYTVPDAVIEHRMVDLADLASVRALADGLVGETIDLLVLNAGIMALPQAEYTADGFEKQIGVNHFGHFYLYCLLEPKLRAQKHQCRVVCLSSIAHTMGTLDPKDLHYRKRQYAAWDAYGQSKLANLLFAKSVADRSADSPITALSVHPGVIRTPLWRNTPASNAVGGALLSLFLTDKSVEQGAATTVYACLSPECGRPDYAGAYLADCEVKVPSTAGRDEDGSLRKALWSATEEQLAAAGYDCMAQARASNRA